MQIQRHTEFSIYLEQRPGELAGLLGALAAAGVRVDSICTTEHRERGCVRVLGHPVDALRHVCESLVESGVGPVVEAEVVAVSLDRGIGLVRDLAVAMADHRVNVRYCYLVPSEGAAPPAMAFRFDDTAEALRVLDALDLPPVARGEGSAA